MIIKVHRDFCFGALFLWQIESAYRDVFCVPKNFSTTKTSLESFQISDSMKAEFKEKMML